MASPVGSTSDSEANLNAEAQDNDSQEERLPRSIYYIIPSEFGDRYAFYSTKLFFNQYLQSGFGLSPSSAKLGVHLFNVLVYVFPVLGAAVSDSYLGKYHTIVYSGVFSILGNAMLAVFSINNFISPYGTYPLWSFILPVLCIAIGAGGTKPCVSAHGGDQFKMPQQKRLLDRYFTLYGWALAIAILLAVTLLPYVKESVQCFGSPCYLIAYGVPAMMTALGLGIFIYGRSHYVVVAPPGEFLPWQALKLILGSLRVNVATRPTRLLDWSLEVMQPKYSEEFIIETRYLIQALVMMSPSILQYMLESQTNTEWQNQYNMMNKFQFGLVYVPTEACSIMSVALNLVFIPVLSYSVYPFLNRSGINCNEAFRVGLGFLTCLAGYLYSIILQYYVIHYYYNDQGLPRLNPTDKSCVGCLNGAWQLPQWILISLTDSILIPSATMFVYTQVGPKFKSFSASFYLLSVGLGNSLVVLLEPLLVTYIHSNINRQWIYFTLAIFGFLWYLWLARYWYVARR